MHKRFLRIASGTAVGTAITVGDMANSYHYPPVAISAGVCGLMAGVSLFSAYVLRGKPASVLLFLFGLGDGIIAAVVGTQPDAVFGAGGTLPLLIFNAFVWLVASFRVSYRTTVRG